MATEETIFAEALGKGSAAEQAAYLDQACSGNVKLRRDVEALLEAHRRVHGILEAAPRDADQTQLEPSLSAIGSTIGPYKLLEQIGGGGMGVVYMAEQHRPVRRMVALKIIKPGMDSGQVIARFEAERQALTMMDHPNIAKVLDAGTTDTGRPYFVMELVKGIPITDYCDQARLTTRQRLELFIQVCNAVQHAHQKGVIHRDLKPTNVLVTLHDDKPVPKVIDFGIAKAAGQLLTDKTLFTNYAQMLGTPLYMSPEQAQISGLDVDTRSDVYSLGVLLYELLTGTTPFDQQRLREAAYDEMRRIIREEDPPKPSTRLSTMGEKLNVVSADRHTNPKRLGQLLRGELDWIVMKSLEKDRARRYETANGLGRDVERHLRCEAVHACPPSAYYRFRKFARRNKVGVLTAISVAVGVMISFVALVVSAVVIAQERTDAVVARDSAREARDEARDLQKVADGQRQIAQDLEIHARERKAEAERRELTTRRYLYAAHMNVAQQAAELPDPARTVRLLNFHRPRPGQEDLRSFEWYYWWRQCHRSLLNSLENHTDAVCSVAFSPDGRSLASAGADRTLKLWDLASGRERVSLAGHTDHIIAVAFSPDGKTLASGSRDRRVKLWDAASGTALATFEGHPDWILCLAFSPDGRTLASADGAGLTLWDLTTKQRQRTLVGHLDPVCSVAFAPDGERIASASHKGPGKGNGSLKLWDVATGTAENIFEAEQAQVTSVAFSPDGKALAAAISNLNAKSEVKLWEVATGELKETLRGDGFGFTTVAFSPDGQNVASGGEDRTITIWDLATGVIKSTLVGHGHFVSAIAFSPDQKTLASGSLDRTVKLWDLTAVEPTTYLGGHANDVLALAFSSDGETVASASQDQIRLWDVASGNLKTAIEGHADHVTSVAFSPDGRTLASASLDRTVKLWDTATGKLRMTPEERGVIAHGSVRSPVAFSPDGKTLATADHEHAVRLWDVDTGMLKSTLKGHASPVLCLAFAPDGETLASVGSWDHTVRLWDVAAGRTRFILEAQERYLWPFWTAAFSPDGKTLATGGDPAIIRLWDVATGRQTATFTGHAGVVWTVSFSPDGKTLASSAYDGTIKFWDLATGEPKTRFRHGASAMAFSPDGRILATNSANGVRLWRAASEDEVLARDRSTIEHEATKNE